MRRRSRAPYREACLIIGHFVAGMAVAFEPVEQFFRFGLGQSRDGVTGRHATVSRRFDRGAMGSVRSLVLSRDPARNWNLRGRAACQQGAIADKRDGQDQSSDYEDWSSHLYTPPARNQLIRG